MTTMTPHSDYDNLVKRIIAIILMLIVAMALCCCKSTTKTVNEQKDVNVGGGTSVIRKDTASSSVITDEQRYKSAYTQLIEDMEVLHIVYSQPDSLGNQHIESVSQITARRQKDRTSSDSTSLKTTTTNEAASGISYNDSINASLRENTQIYEHSKGGSSWWTAVKIILIAVGLIIIMYFSISFYVRHRRL